MKTLTAPVINALSSKVGIDAQIVLKIEFPPPFGTEWYGDKTTTIGTKNVVGAIKSMSEISASVGQDFGPAVSSVQVELIDPGGLLYLHITASTEPIELSPVTIYLHITGTGEADLVELMRGVMGAPIDYSDAERTLRFDVVSPVRSTPATYTLDQELDSSVPDESDGAVLPLCFGVPRDVPAVLYRRGPQTRLLEDIDSSDTKFEVENAGDFPSGTLTLRIEDEMVTATISGNEVTASARNVQKYSNLLTATRPSADPDKNNPFVLWCTDASKDHVGNYVIIDADDVPGTNGSSRARLCVAQKGTKLVFDKPWTGVSGGLWTPGANLTYDVRRYAFEWVNVLGVNANQWQTQAGASVTVFKDSSGAGQEFADYIVNTVASNDVLRVRAYRTYQNGKLGLTEKRLVSVPTSLWSWSNVSLNVADGSGVLVTKTVTRVRFPVALGMLNQGWDDGQVFVSLESSIGTNISDQIKWLLQNRTNVTVNTASFNAAATQLSKYRADFAIRDDADALEVAHALAWQGRSALTVFGATARLIYLSATPSTYEFALTEADVVRDSYRLGLTTVEDVKTVLRGTWRRNYTGDGERIVRRRKNVASFGARRWTKDFFAFQRVSLVRKTGTFWNNRYSRTWKLVTVDADLSMIVAEPLDRVAMQLPFTLLPSVIGWVHDVLYSSFPHRIKLLVWMPLESGQNFVSASAYLDDSGDSAISDPDFPNAKQLIARIAPFAFSMYSEPLQQAMPVKILKVITSKTAEVEIYPNGLSFPASGTDFLTVLGTPAAVNWQVGKTGLAWRMPGGDLVSDVWAQP